MVLEVLLHLKVLEILVDQVVQKVLQDQDHHCHPWDQETLMVLKDQQDQVVLNSPDFPQVLIALEDPESQQDLKTQKVPVHQVLRLVPVIQLVPMVLCHR